MEIEIKDLPAKYKSLWEKCLPLLRKGRPGDDKHAAEVAELVLNYDGEMKVDKEILIPVAMMHDIGHAAILPEHFKHVTGPEKIVNGKLVHMLAGAKIAKDFLEEIGYDKKKTAEIVDIISVHDADQLKDIDVNKVYDTENKRVFHDLDSMDRYTKVRIKSMKKMYDNNKELFELLRKSLKSFFYPEFKKIAEKRLDQLEKNENN